ncbi:MAG TPA: TonB-dependent receptor [Steroidobacteraceae bacterium]|jgi:outer membrane receptor protein involved in Fe transport
MRKLKRLQGRKARQILWKVAPVASAILACMQTARAQAPSETEASANGLEEVVVTAQKRAENLQNVPISIQAINTEKLEQMNVTNFDDYAKLLPSVSFQTAGPAFEHTYMRGVASGGDGNHSGSLPSVGMYLDEQPVTTIDGNLNIHIYDIARVEALSGPQGTLYGASSEAGTIRIITNKPDPTAFKGGYDVEGNTVDHGGQGYTVEGFVNIPITSIAAVRLVGWDIRDAGFIDNVPGTVTYPSDTPAGITQNNAAQVKKDYNTVDTKGGRAALKVDLTDNWTITPQIMGQATDTHGFFGYNPAVGDLEVQKYFPEEIRDSWIQSALTIEGKINNFDIVYAGAYLTRNTHENEDYTDYSLAYDNYYGFSGFGTYFRDNAGKVINPAQYIVGRDHYTKLSHELRVTTPKENRFRLTAGVFLQRQVHEISQDYTIPGGPAMNDPLASSGPFNQSVPGWPGTIWLTDQERVDRDAAVFGEASFDILDNLTLNAGLRHWRFDNTLQGFYGFNDTYSSHSGVAICALPFVPFHGAPCQDLNGRSTDTGNSPKINLTYKIDPDHMIYVTWSKGFRPGGVNRNGGGKLPPYKPDFLTNYEFGWKTTWLDNRLRWNGAIFEEKWKDFQFAFLGINSLTIINNAGEAEIKGTESELEFRVTNGFTLAASAAYLDAKLTQTYCDNAAPDANGIPTCLEPGYEGFAPSGTQLPVTPKFKANLTGRYTWSLGNDYLLNLQASETYVGARWADLRVTVRDALGQMPSYAVTDLSAELQRNSWTATLFVSNAFDKRAILDRTANCDVFKCGTVAIYNTPNTPRMIGLKFGQRF